MTIRCLLIGKTRCADYWIADVENTWFSDTFNISLPYPDDIEIGEHFDIEIKEPE
jgi:hypothetical protein